MTYESTSFFSVTYSHQDDGSIIVKGCMQWKSRKENPQKLTQLSSRSCNVCETLICRLVYLFNVFGEHGRYEYIGNINHLW